LLAVGAIPGVAPPLIWSLPFVALLVSIAAFPLIAPRWWHHNFPWVALPIGALVVAYYIFFFGNAERMFYTAHEYVAFISLIGSLFVVSGGLHIGLHGRLSPRENVILLAVGAVIANIVGTTGASVILIRPFIRGNSWRWSPYHVVFFIFIVSNCGGALTPIGDPPLFLGYIKGVPVSWVLGALWYKWALAIALLLAAYYVFDRREYARHSLRERIEAERPERTRVDGLLNLVFIAVILGAAFIQRPMFVREAIMIAAAVASYLTTPKRIHKLNEFTFFPVKEVAILFAGIFGAMVPTLDWLSVNAASLGLRDAGHFYWITGSLSTLLDNAPTYLNFLTAAMALHGLSAESPLQVMQFAAQHADFLRSISIAAVFFGAGTYIGNGPNFMVKSIVDHAGLRTPTFIEFVYKYTLPILLPLWIITYLWVR